MPLPRILVLPRPHPRNHRVVPFYMLLRKGTKAEAVEGGVSCAWVYEENTGKGGGGVVWEGVGKWTGQDQ